MLLSGKSYSSELMTTESDVSIELLLDTEFPVGDQEGEGLMELGALHPV